jgi:hypothetical protein
VTDRRPSEMLAHGFAEALPVVVDGAPATGTISMLIGVELRDEPTGLCCDELARRLHRRRADVLQVLQVLEDEPRFRCSGSTCGRRWMRWDGTSRPPSGRRDIYIARTREGRRAA